MSARPGGGSGWRRAALWRGWRGFFLLVWAVSWLGLGVCGTQGAGDPRIVVQPRGGTVKAGKDFGLNVLPDGTQPFTYQWYFKGSVPAGQTNRPLEDQTGPILWLEDVTAAQSGVYSVEVRNAKGTNRSRSVSLTVTDPVIVVQPQGARVAVGTNYTFEVEGRGLEPLAYQWYFKQTALAGQTNRILELANLSLAQSGSYSVRVSNSVGSVRSANVNLTVLNLAISTQPKGGTVRAGQDFCFTVQAFGAPPLAYQWYFNGQELPGATSHVFCVINAAPTQAGLYSVAVRNGLATNTSAGARLRVQPPAIVSQPQGGTVRACADFCFGVEAAGITPISYQWFFQPSLPPGRAAQPLAGQTNKTLCLTNVTASSGGTYFVQVSGPLWTNTSANAILKVTDPVIVAQPRGGEVAAGTNVCLEVAGCGTGPLSYQWYFNRTPLPGATGRTLCLGNAAANHSGTYSVLVSNAVGSVWSANATLKVVDLRFVTAPQGGSALAGSNFCFSVEAFGTPPLTFQWMRNETNLLGATSPILCLTNLAVADSGLYRVRVTNPAGTIESPGAPLAVIDLAILRQPRGGTEVAGANFTFEVEAFGAPPLSYQWVFEDRPLAGETNRTLLLTNLRVNQSGSYAVRVSNAGGSLLSAKADLSVSDLLILRQPEGATVRAGTNYCFEVVAGGTPPFTYQWFANNVALPGATDRQLCLTYVTKAQSGAYSVMVSNVSGGRLSAKANLGVSDPAIWIQPVGGWVTTNSDFRFAVVAEGTQPLLYQWYFKNRSLPGEVNPILELRDITAAQSGAYYVRVRNAAGTVNSSNANLSVYTGAPRLLRTGAFTIAAPGRAQLQLLLQGNGVENALSFSMGFDPGILRTNATFVPASANALVTVTNTVGLITNTFSSPADASVTVTNVLTNGLVGVTLRLEAGQRFLRTNLQVIGTLQFEVIGTRNPLLGRLAFVDQPWPLAAADSQGTVLDLGGELAPSGVLEEEIPELHEPSGLFRQHILLSNPTAAIADRFRVTAYGLGFDSLTNKIRLHNAQQEGSLDADQDGLADDPAFFVFVAAPTNGGSVRLTMEYYVSDHQACQPSYSFAFDAGPSLLPPRTQSARIRASRYVNGEFLLEIATRADKTYYVQYADTPEGLADPGSVKTSHPPIDGTGTVVVWFDTGPPRTESAPVAGMRFYQVRVSPPD